MKSSNEPMTLQCGHCGSPVWAKGYGAPEVCAVCHQPVLVSERLRAALGRWANALKPVIRSFQVTRRAGVEEALEETSNGVALDWFVGVTVFVAAVSAEYWALSHPSDPLAHDLPTWMAALVMPLGLFFYSRYDARSKARAALARSALEERPEEGTEQEQLLRSRMARFRRERSDWYLGKGKRILRPTSVVTILVIPFVFLAIGALIPEKRYRSRKVDAAIASVASAIWMVVLGGAIVFSSRVSRDAARWSSAGTALRAELGGTWLDPVSWLNSVWAGPAPRDIGRWGLHTQTVGCRLSGYPVLFYGNTSHILVFLAAWTPGVSDTEDGQPIPLAWRNEPGAAAIASELSASDFDVAVTRAGLLAIVSYNSLTEFRAHPQRLVALAPAVRRIADLAVAIQAQHVDKALFGAPDQEGEA